MRLLHVILLLTLTIDYSMAAEEVLLIDDRSIDDATSSTGIPWRLLTDNVMGGVSAGKLAIAQIDNMRCLQMTGQVRLENNGGFVQAAIDIPGDEYSDIADYSGILIQVHGNGEEYNVHLRTTNLWLPWQAYRSSFKSAPAWQKLYLPFAEFKGYRTGKPLDVSKLERIAVVAIGREFSAELCVAKIGFYR